MKPLTGSFLLLGLVAAGGHTFAEARGNEPVKAAAGSELVREGCGPERAAGAL
jgi:hypothetical protein